MSRLSLGVVGRVAGYSVVIVLLGSTLAVLVTLIRDNREVRGRLSDLDARVTLSSQQDQSRIDELSQDMKDVSAALRRDSFARQRAAAEDMARMGNGLSARLDDIWRHMDELAAAPRQSEAVTVTLASPQVEPASQAAAPEPPSVAPLAVDQDLPALHRLKQGVSLFESGRYEESRRILETALAAQPQDSSVRLYYAASMFRANPADATNYSLIEKNLRSVLNSDAENLLALQTLAMMEVEQKKWADARQNLNRLIALQPEEPGFLKTAGYCALMAGDLRGARDYFERAAHEVNADGEAWSALGDCESRLGNAVSAEEAWKLSLSTLSLASPAGSRTGLGLSVKLARSAYERGAYEQSLAYARDGERMGTSALLRAYEGLSLEATGSVEEGRAVLEGIVSSSDVQAADLAKNGLQVVR